MKKTAFAIALMLMPIASITTAHADDGLACLQEKVKVSAATVEPADFGPNLNLSVTNGLKWAVRNIVVSYKVTSEGRSVPWAEKEFGMEIPGGIEPGETRAVSTTLMLTSDAPAKLQASALVINVTDAEKRPLLAQPSYQGFSKDLAPLGCN
jgi:hypothetical protein